MNCNPRIVIALGGNALQSKDSDSTAEAQLEVVRRTCERIADISCAGYEMAVSTATVPRWAGSSWPARPPRTWCLPCPLTSAVP